MGGFVRLKGEDPKNPEDFHAKDSFISAKIRNKIFILIAGISMNVIVAWILFTIIFTLGTRPISIIPENAFSTKTHSYLMPTLTFLQEQGFISGTLHTSPAHIAMITPDGIGTQIGLQTGDTIISINTEPVNARNIGSVLKKHIGQPITIIFERNNKHIITTGTCPEDNCILGLALKTDDITLLPIKFSLGKAMGISIQEIKAQTSLTLSALKIL